jgi:hypothetical protein
VLQVVHVNREAISVTAPQSIARTNPPRKNESRARRFGLKAVNAEPRSGRKVILRRIMAQIVLPDPSPGLAPAVPTPIGIELARMSKQNGVRKPGDDWTGITSASERRKLQNRLSQRRYSRYSILRLDHTRVDLAEQTL